MSVPNFLASSHFYSTMSATCAQNVIDELHTILETTNDPPWTNPSGNTFTSPVDDDGRYFTANFSVKDTHHLVYHVVDQYGAAVEDRNLIVDAAGTEIRIYSGEYHLWIDSMRSTPENLRMGILDLSPQGQTTWASAVFANGHQRNSDDWAGNKESGQLATTATLGGNGQGAAQVYMVATTDSRGAGYDLAGNLVTWPVFVGKFNTYPVIFIGRLYQALLCPNSLAYGVEVTIPIDTDTTAKFRVAGVAENWYQRLLIRAD
jgi:hypothetical protein